MVKIFYEFVSFSVFNTVNQKWIWNPFSKVLTKRVFRSWFFRCKVWTSIYKKLLNVWAMEVLFAIIFLSTNKEFGDVLVLDFSVITDFTPFQIFLRFFWISLEIILIILFFRFFYCRNYNVSNSSVVIVLG